MWVWDSTEALQLWACLEVAVGGRTVPGVCVCAWVDVCSDTLFTKNNQEKSDAVGSHGE